MNQHSDPEPTLARRERVATMTAQGMSAAHIAAILRVAERTIVRDRDRLGITKTPGSPLTADQITQAEALLADGCSYHQVSKTLGRDHRTISRHFPGHTLTRQEISERALMGQQLARLERKHT